MVISVIGPPCRPEEAWHGCEPAFTLIPDFGLSGLVAMAVASVVLLWSVAFVHRRHGGLVLVLLSAILFLVGGGFTTLWFGILAGIAGTRIGGPLPRWRARVPPRLSRSLARLWPWLLVAYLGWWAGSWAIAAFAPDLMLRLPPAVTIATPVVALICCLPSRTLPGPGQVSPTKRRSQVNASIKRPEVAMDTAREAESTDSRWRALYRLAGAGALLSAVFIPIQVLVFIVWPPPLEGTAADWFALFRDNRLVGLLDLDLLLIADNLFLVPILLALYVLLRRDSQSLMAMATVLGFLGIVFFIASNPAFEMLSLSQRYAAATTEAQRSTFLAAGEAMLATWQGTAFQTYYLLGSIAGIMIGAVMLRSAVFSNLTGWMAILGNAIGLGLYVPTVGVYISVFSVLFLEVWYVLIARRLLQLGRRASEVEASP